MASILFLGCRIYGCLGFFCGVVSISTLALMSFSRYIHVCKSSKCKVFFFIFEHLDPNSRPARTFTNNSKFYTYMYTQNITLDIKTAIFVLFRWIFRLISIQYIFLSMFMVLIYIKLTILVSNKMESDILTAAAFYKVDLCIAKTASKSLKYDYSNCEWISEKHMPSIIISRWIQLKFH